jgi:hypothetical protein
MAADFLKIRIPPRWGYSIGQWERDPLVVESGGFNGKMCLDLTGHPRVKLYTLQNASNRPGFGHLEITLTIDVRKHIGSNGA